jgi:Tol biopolymer transport system component
MHHHSRWSVLGSLVLVAFGCNHSDAFTPDDYSSDQPLLPGTPTRLTFNTLTDVHASWLPDGSAILYSFQVPGRSDRDQCLGLIPAGGGTRQLEICNPLPETNDTSDVFGTSAASADRRVAYNLFRANSTVHTPQLSSTLELASFAQPLQAEVLQAVPYTLPTGQLHTGMSHLSWLDDTRLVYVGLEIFYIRTPAGTFGFAPDTLDTGRDIVIVELNGSGGGATLTAVPNTDLASSVAPGTNGNSLYYTVSGDSQVYTRDLGSGTTSVIHDFGAGNIVRDVDVVGTTLVAIVGGFVEFLNVVTLGPVQPDEGGVLTMVDLSTGTETVLDTDTTVVYRRPAISPDGSSVVVERYRVLSATTVDRRADLYVFPLP